VLTAVLCGVAAAGCWGVTALLLTRSARGGSPSATAQWFALYQAALLLIPFAVAIVATSSTARTILICGAGGVAQGLAALCYSRALQRADVGVVAPLTGLQGVVVVVLAVAVDGEPLPALAAAGLAAAAVGGFAVAMTSGRDWSGGGVAYAFGAAALFGLSLWALVTSDATAIVGAFALNLVGGLTLVALLGYRHPPREWGTAAPRPLVAAAATNVMGFLFYVAGVDSGSVAVTVVLGAQFSLVAAVGGFLVFHERLLPRQVVAIVLLLAGITLVAGGTAV
jgi:drug/metabolite transporter (DMT)-like permease